MVKKKLLYRVIEQTLFDQKQEIQRDYWVYNSEIVYFYLTFLRE